MKFMAIEQITRLESMFHDTASNARFAANKLMLRYGGEWIVEPVPDSFPVNEERLHSNYKAEEVRAMIKGERKNLTPARGEWISVKDRLPTDDDFTKSKTREILCSFGGQFMMVLCKRNFEEWVEDHDVTHWMKIPTPPKVDKKEG